MVVEAHQLGESERRRTFSLSLRGYPLSLLYIAIFAASYNASARFCALDLPLIAIYRRRHAVADNDIITSPDDFLHASSRHRAVLHSMPLPPFPRHSLSQGAAGDHAEDENRNDNNTLGQAFPESAEDEGITLSDGGMLRAPNLVRPTFL